MELQDSLKMVLRLNGEFKRAEMHRAALSKARQQLEGIVGEMVKSEKMRYTGWYVLLKRAGEGWQCVAVVNPERVEAMPEEWDLSIPVPDPETVPEFEGL